MISIKKSNILKVIAMFLILIFSVLTPISCIADDMSYEEVETTVDVNSEISESSSESDTLSASDLNSRSCIVLDRTSKQILFGKNENNKVKMASTTKIMTAIIIIENYNLNDTVEVSKKSANTGGSRLGLKTGDKITVRDLLYGLMLCSGNDAAVSLAEYAGGSIQGFADLMNQKAADLNLTNSHFESPHGLDSDEHFTTAYELAKLTDYALQNKTFLDIVGTKNYTVTINGYPKALSNTNELLGNLNGVYGVKTGFTNGANRCLVTACKRGDMDIICVVLGADTKNFRTKDSIKLIEYAFKTYEYINIEEKINTEFSKWKDENINSFTIDKGASSFVDLKLSEFKTPIITVKKELLSNLKISFTCNTNLTAPVDENTIIGSVMASSNGTTIFRTDIIVANNIRKKWCTDYLYDFFKTFNARIVFNF
jgi:D-alanyl-D-alanine carboxypeptidase (penicillin-binding protein 5/6)